MIMITFNTYIPSLSFFLMVEMSMGTLIIFLYVGNCLVLTGVRKGQESSWPDNSDNIVWHIEISLSTLLTEVLFPFFLLFVVLVSGTGSLVSSIVLLLSRPLLVFSDASSSSAVLNIWLGLLNFFFGAFPLHPGQRHFPLGVCNKKIWIKYSIQNFWKATK